MVQKNKDSVKKAEEKGKTKVEAAKTNKRNPQNSRVRECLKEEPLEPIYTGRIKKPKQAKRPKFGTRKRKIPKKISKVKSADQKSHPDSTTSSRKTPGLKVKPKNQSRKKKSPLPTIVVEKDEFESEVIFNPRTSCRACLTGRKGEGGNDCWSCRLTRLQNIQEEKMKSLN